eukprot:1159793-Pelagomonas_calceolata.AAC.2
MPNSACIVGHCIWNACEQKCREIFWEMFVSVPPLVWAIVFVGMVKALCEPCASHCISRNGESTIKFFYSFWKSLAPAESSSHSQSSKASSSPAMARLLGLPNLQFLCTLQLHIAPVLVSPGTMGSFKAVTAKALVDAGAGTPLITCVPHADQEVAGGAGLIEKDAVHTCWVAACTQPVASVTAHMCLFVPAQIILLLSSRTAGAAGVAAWAIEQLGQHSEETAGPLVTAGALMALTQVYCRCKPARTHAHIRTLSAYPRPGETQSVALRTSTSPTFHFAFAALTGCSMPKKKTELRSKRKSSIKTLIRCAPSAQSLEPFVDKAIPPPLLKHFLRRVCGHTL